MPYRLFLQILRRHKPPLAVFVALTMVMPMMDVLLASLVYFLVEPASIVDAFGKLVGSLSLELPINLPINPVAVQSIVAVAGIGAACIIAGGKYSRNKLLARIKYQVYIKELSALLRNYLFLSVHRYPQVNKDAIASVAIKEIGASGHNFFHLMNMGASVFSVLVLAGMSLVYSPYLVLLSVGLGTAAVLINYRRFSILSDIGEVKVQAHRKFIKFFEELLRATERIKFDGLEESVLERGKKVFKKSFAWRVPRALTRAKMDIISEGFSVIAIVLIVFTGTVFLKVEGAVFLAMLIIFSRLRTYVTAIQVSYASIKEYRPSVQKVADTMAELEQGAAVPAPPGRSSPAAAVQYPRRIRLTGVDCGYNDEVVLTGVSLDIEKGDRVLVQGPSGQGKSTLLKLLSGFLSHASGESILEIGSEKEPLEFERLRRDLFFCSNELYLFDSTVRQNVDYGGRFTDEEIRSALGRACLMDFLESTVEELDLWVGEDGRNLSLGQRQRLLLSRLFLQNSRLVILDEVTSNVDVETERKIFENIERHLNPEAILVVASHRVTDAIDFNKTIAITEGRTEVYSHTQRHPDQVYLR